ncbi:MAG: dolichyl-phosphate beta-glucosyltransferase [Pyrinomonadaceae bacterium]
MNAENLFAMRAGGEKTTTLVAKNDSMLTSLSIVVPAYNEAARLGKTVRAILRYIDEHVREGELIVVDDGSRDHTTQVAEEAFASSSRKVPARVIRYAQNRGKGYAVRAGLLAARHPVALFSDADLSTPITETPKLVLPIENGVCDVAFGSRALDRSLIGVHQPWQREQSGRVFNLAVKLATGMPFWDTQCGFKAFRMTVCRPLVEASVIDRFAFDVELLYAAHLTGLRLCEQAVRWDDNEGSTVSFLGGLHGFTELRMLRKQARRGVYNDAIDAAHALAVASTDTPRAMSAKSGDYATETERALAGVAQDA